MHRKSKSSIPFAPITYATINTFFEHVKGWQLTLQLAMQSGPDYFVEVDIVMDAETPLWKSHDISQALQDKLETLPGVARAFVHVDYETEHRPVRIPQSDNGQRMVC